MPALSYLLLILVRERPISYIYINTWVPAKVRGVPLSHLEIAGGQDVPHPPANKADLDGLGRRPQNAREGRNNLACVGGENTGGVLRWGNRHV